MNLREIYEASDSTDASLKDYGYKMKHHFCYKRVTKQEMTQKINVISRLPRGLKKLDSVFMQLWTDAAKICHSSVDQCRLYVHIQYSSVRWTSDRFMFQTSDSSASHLFALLLTPVHLVRGILKCRSVAAAVVSLLYLRLSHKHSHIHHYGSPGGPPSSNEDSTLGNVCLGVSDLTGGA